MLIARIASVGVLSGILAVGATAAESGGLAANCPGYASHLRSARACFDRGDRSGGLAELRHAEQALQECIRGHAGETGLAARALRSTPTA